MIPPKPDRYFFKFGDGTVFEIRQLNLQDMWYMKAAPMGFAYSMMVYIRFLYGMGGSAAVDTFQKINPTIFGQV